MSERNFILGTQHFKFCYLQNFFLIPQAGVNDAQNNFLGAIAPS